MQDPSGASLKLKTFRDLERIITLYLLIELNNVDS